MNQKQKRNFLLTVKSLKTVGKWVNSIMYHIFCLLDECSSGEETGPNIFVPPTTQCLKARAPKHSLLCSSPIPGSGNHHHGIVTYLFSSNLSKRQNDTDKQNVLI